MRRILALIAAGVAGLLVAGCGSSGSSAEPPATLTLTPGDGIVTVSWVMESGVDYWLFYANNPGISTSNWTTIPGSKSVISASSPLVVGPLANGLTYSFVMNARKNGGPAGGSTPTVSATPRLAGSLPSPWTAGAATGANDLRGLNWTSSFIAVGAAGAMFSSPDGVTWTALNSGVAGNLNAVVNNGAYVAAGDGGTILYSLDTTTWTAQTSGTVNNLYALARNGVQVVAVGAKGTIITSNDGKTWTAAANNAGTVNDLYGVTFAPTGIWIAVGAAGTLLTSTDGSTWKAVTSGTARDLKAVAYGTSSATNAGVYAAVGAAGTLVTSTDAATWTAQPALGVNTLAAVVYGTQFIAVGAAGSIYTSTDGVNWTAQPSATAKDLNAIGHATYSYSVVGATGTNLLAK